MAEILSKRIAINDVVAADRDIEAAARRPAGVVVRDEIGISRRYLDQDASRRGQEKPRGRAVNDAGAEFGNDGTAAGAGARACRASNEETTIRGNDSPLSVCVGSRPRRKA